MDEKQGTRVWWNGSAAGPRPERRGPKRGEIVCPKTTSGSGLWAGKTGEVSKEISS